MSELALAAIVFVVLHVIPSLSFRGWLIKMIGDPAYMGLFSLASVLSLAWMVYAYSNAPASVPLWTTGPLVRWLTAILMLLPFVMVVEASTSPNPTAVMSGGVLKSRRKWTNIFAITRHPLMWGIVIWAGLHLLNRPDATSALFFGSLAFLAIAGSMRQDVRKRKELGKEWEAFEAQTSYVPFAGLLSGKSTLKPAEIAGWPLAIAVFLWLVVLYFHGSLFGAYPLGG